MRKRYPDFVSVVDPAYTTLSPDRSRVLSFDREGRLIGFFRDGLTYRRGLNSKVVVRWRGGTRQRRWLSDPEAYNLYDEVYTLAEELVAESPEPLRERLREEILDWTPRQLLDEQRRFNAVYQPVPILPPDQYRSIVLQVTEGCTWNQCTFCDFYEGRRFRLRSLPQFQKHVQAVRRFFGKGLRMRRGIFLGDGNALALSTDRLVEYIEIIRTVFPDDPLYGFVDVFSGERHTVDAWRKLASLGLHRVYIGMESGSDSILRFINKPNTQAETIALVKDVKAAGLAVSPIVMVGIGGHKFRQEHEQATLQALRRMPLGEGDILYLSPFIQHPNSRYSSICADEGIVPLDELEIEAGIRAMSRETRSFGIKTSRYDIRDFLY